MGRIVVGVDGSDGSRKALQWAVNEAKFRHATGEAGHAYHFAYVDPYPFLPIDRGSIEKAAWRLLDEVVAGVDAHELDRPIEKIAIAGPSARSLIDAGKGADMLIVGSRGHGGFTGLLLGSVSQQIVTHATCPVVVVPPDE